MKCFPYLFLFLIFGSCGTQKVNRDPMVIHTSNDRFYLYSNQQKGNLPLAYLPRPFFLQTVVPDTGLQLSVVTERDSLSFRLFPNRKVFFNVVDAGGDTLKAYVKGLKLVPPANFSDSYIEKHSGKNFIEIPQVYELLNIIIAITPQGLVREGLVEKKTSYHQDVLTHFLPYADHPVVAVIDKMLTIGRYSYIKMDSYAFEFKRVNIVKSDVYDRISWGDYNTIEEYIPFIEDFAQKSNFLSFYEQYTDFYESLIEVFGTNVPLQEMKIWLEDNFSGIHYDSYKVIFSPLTGDNQSSTHITSNGYSEAQAHVNFPYGIEKSENKDSLVYNLGQMITFTELNHSYINKETEENMEHVQKAFSNLDVWIDKSKAAGDYSSPESAFNEYMNWGLVSLYFRDKTHNKEFEQLKSVVERTMSKRGFIQFEAFQGKLLSLYKNRQTKVADLYEPLLIWAAEIDQ